MTNVVKTDKLREELSTSYFVTQSPKLELILRKFLLKYEPRVKEKKLHGKEQQICAFFLFLRFKETFT